jgi:hypothetical protein
MPSSFYNLFELPGWKLIAAAAATGIALSGCGKSVDAKREDIVKCSGFSLALINITPGSPLYSTVEAKLANDGISSGDTFSIGNAAQKYSSTMDPAKVTQLTQEGASAALGFIRNNDANGIADFVKGCVATYKDLGS